MTSDFTIANEKHEAAARRWRSGFEIPEQRERVTGYASERERLSTALRGITSARRTRVPFELARGVQGGVFLHGPPGCGKTLLVSDAAATLKVPLLLIQPAHILGEHAGETGRVLASLFAAGMDVAREQGGAIVFFDELEAYGRRSPTMDGFQVTLSNLLKLIDRASGVPEGHRLAVVAASNDRDSCEPALLSRLSTHIAIGPPDAGARFAYLSGALESARVAGFLDGDVDVDALVSLSDGLTLRQIAQALDAVNAACMGSLVRGDEPTVSERQIRHALRRYASPRVPTVEFDPSIV